MTITINQNDFCGYADFHVFLDRPVEGRPDLWVNTQYKTITGPEENKSKITDAEALIAACRAYTPEKKEKTAPAKCNDDLVDDGIGGDINNLLRANGNSAAAE